MVSFLQHIIHTTLAEVLLPCLELINNVHSDAIFLLSGCLSVWFGSRHEVSASASDLFSSVPNTRGVVSLHGLALYAVLCET